MNETPQMIGIKEIVKESENIKTFFLDTRIEALPGQFVMAWLPGINEKPFSLSYNTAITVLKKGAFTEKMHNMKQGDSIGIRGPYGNSFPVKENVCIVAGGIGIAPLAPIIEKLQNVTVILAAKTKNDIIFKKRLEKFNPHIATDDGSEGFRGFATGLLEDLIKENKFDAIYTCGPEIMMSKAFDISEKNNIPCYASLERYMKCGLGICGQCSISGLRICKDGPVFTSEQLRNIEEFGSYARLKSGKKVSLKEFAEWRSK